ncbi:hypothetical protein [uncultured Fibrobacter sp.]|uniref:hypothetical protein n=1 Tax=uncultured Fibrobacter sp. TaxID=261512 RepID=UPI0025DCCA7B|nr:hypothetical protein [uncultured Fibrobacter sp.]
MQATCSKCNKLFNDKVGMSPMQSNMAIRVRNRVGNICPECRAEMEKTKKGRRRLFFYDAKIAFRCMLLLLPVFVLFAGLIVALALFVI